MQSLWLHSNGSVETFLFPAVLYRFYGAEIQNREFRSYSQTGNISKMENSDQTEVIMEAGVHRVFFFKKKKKH